MKKNILCFAAWLLFWPFLIISKIVKRDKDLWVFSGFDGVYKDNSKYLFEYVIKNTKIKCVWITSRKNEINNIRSQGYDAHLKYSIKGFYYSLFASRYYYSSYVNDINYWCSCGALKINLWHGTPLKVIEKDIEFGDLKFIYNPDTFIDKMKAKILYPSNLISPDIMIASSLYERAIFQSAFEPKTIIDYSSLRTIKYKSEIVSKRKDRILYAPTFRGSSTDDYLNFMLNTLDVLNQISSTTVKVDVSFHPSEKLDRKIIDMYENLTLVNEINVNLYSVLITDFSSIAFDFAALNKEVIFFAADYNNYSNSERGIYSEMDKYLKENIISDHNELYNLMISNEKRSNIKSKFKENIGFFDISNPSYEGFISELDKSDVRI